MEDSPAKLLEVALTTLDSIPRATNPEIANHALEHMKMDITQMISAL
jgi:hypothetical protein